MIFENIDDEKHVEFGLFLNTLAKFVAFLDAPNLKNIECPEGKCIFVQNIVFRYRQATMSKTSQQVIDWEAERAAKIPEIRMLERIKNSLNN